MAYVLTATALRRSNDACIHIYLPLPHRTAANAKLDCGRQQQMKYILTDRINALCCDDFWLGVQTDRLRHSLYISNVYFRTNIYPLRQFKRLRMENAILGSIKSNLSKQRELQMHNEMNKDKAKKREIFIPKIDYHYYWIECECLFLILRLSCWVNKRWQSSLRITYYMHGVPIVKYPHIDGR